MQTTGDIYIPMPNHEAMLKAIRDLARTLPGVMCDLDENDIKIALGEIAGIWPVTILPDLNETMEAAGIPAPAEVEGPVASPLPFKGASALFAAGNRVTVKPPVGRFPSLTEVRDALTPDPAVPLVAIKYR